MEAEQDDAAVEANHRLSWHGGQRSGGGV